MFDRYFPWFLLVFLSLVWGSSFILIKRGLEAFTPMQVGALRMVMAGIVLLPFGLVQLRRVQREHFKYILFVGVIGNAIPAVLFSKAEQHLNSSVAGALNALQPLFTLLIGVLAFGLVIRKKQYMGVAFGFAGAFLLALRGSASGNTTDNLQYGSMVAFATVLYAVSVNIIRSRLQGVRAVQITSISLPAVALPSLIYLLSSDFVHRLQTVPEAPSSFGYIAILGVVGTALAVSLFNKLIQMRGLMMATSIPYTLPLVATFWGLLDNEPIGVVQIVGMAAILGGVYMINMYAGKE